LKLKSKVEAEKDKEKGNQKDKLEIKSTYKVIRLFFAHLFCIVKFKIKISASKCQKSSEVENKIPTLVDLIKKTIRRILHSFNVKLQLNSSKL